MRVVLGGGVERNVVRRERSIIAPAAGKQV
jgi:hypothetical protein